jgi:hypothetical protein
MLEAYIDESGIHGDATVCVVAGYFGRRNQWRHFERTWREVLNQFDFPLSDFHAKDQIKQSVHKPMMLELSRTISKYQIYPVSRIIAVDDFKSLSPEHKKWLTGGTYKRGKFRTTGAPTKPYFVPFVQVVQRVTDYAKPGTKVNLFCGLDRTFSEYAGAYFAKMKTDPMRPQTEWLSRSRLGDISFPLANETPELQAADLFAHLSYVHMLERRSLRDTDRPLSELLALCLKNTRTQSDNACMDKACILETFEKAKRLHERRNPV